MNINLTAPFCSTSYGMSALNILYELNALGHKVSIWPIGPIDGNDVPIKFHEVLRASLHNAQFFDPDAPSVRIYHQFDLAQHIVGRGKKIGWPIFELDQFNKQELHHLFAQNEIIVCSQWAKDVVHKTSNGAINKIHAVPLGVDSSIFYPTPNKSKDKTVFINIGKKELRKGHDIVIECFEKAFTPEDNVELWMVWGNRILDNINESESAAWTNLYANSIMREKIKTQWRVSGEKIEGFNYHWDDYKQAVVKDHRIREWLPTQESIAALLNRADCAIFPSRAEGFNLDLLEAMACGIQVLTTYYSAHTEFVSCKNPAGNQNDENNLLDNAWWTASDKLESAYDGIWFHGQGNWLLIDDNIKKGFINQMQIVHQMKCRGDDMVNKDGIKTGQLFSWRNSAKKLVEAIS